MTVDEIKVIAHIRTDFPEKFGIPRQSGLVPELEGRIVFEPKYRNPEAVRGLEGFNYIWLLWKFEDTERPDWSATIKPPRLGGKKRVGVFATRSPYRPNPIALSSVQLKRIEITEEGPVLVVAGADLRDHTPIYDIKPYLPFADSHPDATDGFAGDVKEYALEVVCDEKYLEEFPVGKREALLEILREDPRPGIQRGSEDKVFGIGFAEKNIKFTVRDGILTVCAVENYTK